MKHKNIHPVNNDTGPSEIDRAIIRSRKAHSVWALLPPKKRAKILKKLLKLIVSHQDEIIQIICEETGKTRIDAVIEIMDVCGHLHYLVKKGPKLLSPEKRSSGIFFWKKSTVMYQPYGVAGIISPWNYPFILTMEPLIQALMAGNTVILKPSEYTPRTAFYMKELSLQAGIPDDVLIVAPGGGRTGRALVEGDTDLISFIGSTGNGLKIAEMCAKQLKPAILEMGGNDPMILFKDCNLQRAVNGALLAYHNSGQTCISIERILIEEEIYDAFAAALKEKVRTLRIGNPEDDADMGPISTKLQYDKFMKQIRDARKKGAVVTGGDVIKNKNGFFVTPAVIENVSGNMLVAKEETFGPCAALLKFKGEDEAVSLANDTQYGLGASIWTKNKKKARRIAGRIEAGNISINEALLFYLIPDLPLGGFKKSGMGKSHSKEGLHHYVKQKSILEDRAGLPSEIWWYPQTKIKLKLLKLANKIFYGW